LDQQLSIYKSNLWTHLDFINLDAFGIKKLGQLIFIEQFLYFTKCK